jgi:hypothetical protein
MGFDLKRWGFDYFLICKVSFAIEKIGFYMKE